MTAMDIGPQILPNLLTGLCQLAHCVGEAEFASIYLRRKAGLEVLASSGLILGFLTEDWWVPVDPDRHPVLAVPDIAHHPLFAAHPVRALPGIRSVMMFPFRVAAGVGGLGLANLPPERFDDFRATCALSQISSLAAAALESPPMIGAEKTSLPAAAAGLEDPVSGRGYAELEPASAFLLSTLIQRPAVRSRNGVSYLIARNWRAAIKTYQVLAMKAVKSDPPSSLVRAIGEEIAVTVRSVHGHAAVRNIVPVPCGNSCRDECLSVRVAADVASRLDAKFVRALKPQEGRGASHPKKSAKLKSYEVLEQPADGTLVVDDVATSGRHLQLAVEALRSPERPVLAVAWVGA
jgi:hypothetical protein